LILDENEAKRLLEKVQRYSKADSFILNLYGSNSYNLRFAVNSVTTNGFSDALSLSVTSSFGKRSGNVSLNKFDDESIKEAVKSSEDIARLSPESKEFMPPLGPQTYPDAKNYSDVTENISAEKQASFLSYIIDKSIEKDIQSAGFYEKDISFTSILSSNGLFVYNKNSRGGLSATTRTKDGTGSGRFEKSYVDISRLEFKKLSDWVIERSILSKDPSELKPGRYTVILEPAAAADMVALCLDFMGSRPADEGRSYFSKKDGGNKIGEELADKKVFMYSDPSDLNAPSLPFNSEGLPRNKTIWFENGVLKNLHRNRFWADKTGQQAIPFPSNLVMSGSDKSIEQLISETDYAILVTRFWYIRTVEQRTMLLTGLTRDGVFEIKDGKINRPVKNFRFNESPINVLKNLVDLSKHEKATGSENESMQIYVPALKVTDFNFSSLSDAI
jgi:predicted Zn-dependent protease